MPQQISHPTNDAIQKAMEYPQFHLQCEAQTKLQENSFSVYFATTGELGFLESSPEFFKGKKGEVFWAPNSLYLGLGKSDPLDEIALGAAFLSFGSLQKKISRSKIQIIFSKEVFSKFSLATLANLFITGFGNGSYSTELLKTKKNGDNNDDHEGAENEKGEKKEKNSIAEIVFIGEVFQQAADKEPFLKACLEYTIMQRHLQAMRQVQALPGNYLNAQSMTSRFEELAKKYSLKLTVLDEKKLQELKAGGILAVNQGSVKEPRLLALEYIPKQTDEATPHVIFVGKGVTFDTGGISLKPGADMHEMKYDMSGSAAAAHSIAAIAELQLPVKATAIVGMVENMPDGAALKPGDVYTSLKGLTIEVQNTDAEGRLVLADLLTYAQTHYQADLIVDLATLTGACAVALGPFYAGLFAQKDEVVDLLKQASQISHEPLWQLPLGTAYVELLKSDIADYNNIGGRYGGSSSAASFLSLFIEKNTRWAHLDIASIAFIKKSYGLYPSVSAGYGLRLLVATAQELLKQKKKGKWETAKSV